MLTTTTTKIERNRLVQKQNKTAIISIKYLEATSKKVNNDNPLCGSQITPLENRMEKKLEKWYAF